MEIFLAAAPYAVLSQHRLYRESGLMITVSAYRSLLRDGLLLRVLVECKISLDLVEHGNRIQLLVTSVLFM